MTPGGNPLKKQLKTPASALGGRHRDCAVHHAANSLTSFVLTGEDFRRHFVQRHPWQRRRLADLCVWASVKFRVTGWIRLDMLYLVFGAVHRDYAFHGRSWAELGPASFRDQGFTDSCSPAKVHGLISRTQHISPSRRSESDHRDNCPRRSCQPRCQQKGYQQDFENFGSKQQMHWHPMLTRGILILDTEFDGQHVMLTEGSAGAFESGWAGNLLSAMVKTHISTVRI